MSRFLSVSTLRLFFVAIFSAFICMPTLQEWLGLFSYSPVIENRHKATKPEGILGIFDLGSRYAQRYEEFYNDTYGLRDFFIKLKNQVDYSVLGMSSGVLIGKDGWIFYRELYQNQMYAIEKNSGRLGLLMRRLRALNSLLKSRGITLVMVSCPAKTTLHKGRVPAVYPEFPQDTVYRRYRQLLKEEKHIVSLDVLGILESLLDDMPVFYKTDFHWTDPAGAMVWRYLYVRLAEESGVPRLPMRRVKIKWEQNISGGENNSLAVFFPPTETAAMLKRSLLEPKGNTVTTQDPNRWTYTAPAGDNTTLLPPTILLGDSFADAFLRAGFAGAFKKLSKFPNRSLRDMYDQISPETRFVVIEHIESLLLQMLQDEWWPKEIIDAAEGSPEAAPGMPAGGTNKPMTPS